MPPHFSNDDTDIDVTQQKINQPGALDLSALGPVISPLPSPSASSMTSSTTHQGPDPGDVTFLSLPDPIEEPTEEADFDSDSDSGSDYLSFHGSDYDDEETKEEKEARERERRMVLEAAGLIVHVDEHVKPPAALVRARSLRGGKGRMREISEGTIGPDDVTSTEQEQEKRKRRPPPAIPIPPHSIELGTAETGVSDSITPATSALTSTSAGSGVAPPMPPRRRYNNRSTSDASSMKDLPPLPPNQEESFSPPTSPSNKDFDPDEHAKRLDDAFERYESFRNANLGGNHNRLSVVSATSTDTSSLYPPLSPTTTMASMGSKESDGRGSGHRPHHSLSNISSHFHGLPSHFGQGKSEEPRAGSPVSGGSKYGQFLQFLSMGRSKTPEEGGSGRKFVISGPIAMSSGSGSGDVDGTSNGLGETRSETPVFGSVSSLFLKDES